MTGDRVAKHYTHGDLERTLLAAAAASGKDVERLQPEDLAGADEFHIGGRPATEAFADRLPLRAGQHLLDVGCGIGGPSRYFASRRGCRVTGVDLTPEYVQVAEALARRMGLSERVAYRCGSALALPFEDASFDGAYMLHVGMNIADKAALFKQVRRVLKPGGFFGIYDVMRVGEGEPAWPLPWAMTPDMSFVASPEDYRRFLETAGFEVETPVSRLESGIASFKALRERAAKGGGAPALGPHIVMGATATQKLANLIEAMQRGLFAPTEMIARLPG